MIYFTSDLHFGHNKPFLYEPRGFASIEEHDRVIIDNWNSIVKPEDEVYVLGDMMLVDNEHGMECVGALHGRIKVIFGNHDTSTRRSLYLAAPTIEVMGFAHQIKYGKYHFYLSHYPTSVGNYDDEIIHNKFYCLCGHTHTQDKFKDFASFKSYHVELDAHNNYPVSIETIIQDIKSYKVIM